MRAEDIVFSIWLDGLGETWVDFNDPSKEVPEEGERFDNAVLYLDVSVSADDRAKFIGCLR
jgi:hypothetical protein